MQLLPLEQGTDLHLVDSLEADTNTIFVDTLVGVPTSGSIQIGPEIIDFTTLDPDHTTIGMGGSGVTRSMPTLRHAKGELVRVLPAGGFTWVIADHACHIIEEVQADGTALDPADWSAAFTPLGAISALVLTLPKWPVNASNHFTSDITATVQGWALSGAMLTNPADVIQWLLTDSRIFNFASARLSAASFTSLQTTLTTLGAAYHRRMRGDETLGDLLREALREAGLWLSAAEPLVLIPWPAAPFADDAELALEAAHQLLSPVATDFSAVPIAAAALPAPHWPPAAIELHGPTQQHGHIKPVYQYPTATVDPGIIPRRIAVYWIDFTATDAPRIAQLAYTHATQWRTSLALHVPLNIAQLSAAETITLDAPNLALTTAAWVTRLELNLAQSAWPKLTVTYPQT